MTLSTRAAIRREALRRAGGFVEDLTSAPDETSAISDAMRYRFGGDDSAGVGMGIYDAADAGADQYRVATAWDDSGGDATVDAMGGPKSGSETVEYYLRNDPSPYEFNDAINRVLSETERVVESVLPTVEGGRHYTLLNAPWIERRRDILVVLLRDSPNVLDNSNFELFGRGGDAQLQAWELSGADSTVTRVDGTYERFAARLARSGTDAVLTQTVPIPIPQLYGRQITVFGRIRSGTASAASVRIDDGSSTTSTSLHDGGSDWDDFTATHTVDAGTQGPLRVELRMATSDGNADFENVVAVEGASVPDWLSRYGDQHSPVEAINATVQMRGSLPVVVTDQPLNRGRQIVVQSKQQFFELTAESGTGGVTDLPFECAVAGTLVKLAEVHSVGKPNAARWERLGVYWLPKYNAWKHMLAEPSPPAATAGAVVGGV